MPENGFSMKGPIYQLPITALEAKAEGAEQARLEAERLGDLNAAAVHERRRELYRRRADTLRQAQSEEEA